MSRVILPIFLVLFLGICSSLASPERFDDFRVYSLVVENESQSASLKKLAGTLSVPLDFWKGSPEVNSSVDVMVSPQDQDTFESTLRENNFKWRTMVENVQELMDNEQPKVQPRLLAGEMEWRSFHTYNEIMDWLGTLLLQFPDILSQVYLGDSREGRPIRGVKLSKKENRPAVLIESNTHAREWITAATATHLLNELLFSTEEKMVYLSENFDWIIFPIVNPDGYVYSFENNRMWRKNRARHSVICHGVDQNRNWGYEWATDVEGSSADHCDETFTGPSAFSEPEVKLLADFMTANRGYVKTVFSFHSYSQLLLYPWSYTADPSPDLQVQKELADITAAAIEQVHGTVYTPRASHGLYPHHGTIIDWTYGNEGILLSMTFEFRDTGRYGFILPPEQIIPNAEEVEEGIYVFLSEASNRNLFD